MKQEATRGLQGVASRRRAGGRGSWRAEIGTVAKLLDFAAACSLDYTTALVAASASASPPSVTGECALGTDVLEDKQEDFECLAAAVPRFASMLLAPEGEPDAPDIPTPRSYAEAILGPYSSQWQAAMDAEMASWKSTGTYVDEVPPPGVNIVDGMWIFRVKRPPRSLPAFKTRYIARGFSQQQGRDYELHSLDFSTAFLQGSLHEEIWLRRPPGFTESFLTGTQFAPATADPSLFLRTDTSLPPFYVLVYVDDLVFATADTEALTLVKSELQNSHTCTDLGELHSYLGLQITRDRARRTITLTQSHMVHQVLQRFGFQFSSPQPTPLSTSHLLSAPPSDESVEPSGLYPELVGCLMVLRYLCNTSGMGRVLGGRGPVVLTGHACTSWVDDSATQRSSKGYTFSLGSGFVSWRSTRSSLVLSSSCEAEIYAGAMAAQELRWLTYLLTNLGEQPHSPPVLYVDNMAMIALYPGAGGAGAGGTGTKGTSAGSAGARGVRHGDPGARAGGTGAGGAGAGGTGVVDPGAGGAGAGGAASGGAGAAGTVQRRPFFVPPLPSSLPPPDTVLRQPDSPLTHVMTLRPSSVPLRVPLPPPPQSSLPAVLDPESDLARAASPSVPHLLATVVTDRSFESTAAFALVAELIDFAAAFRLDYATNLVAQCESDCLPSVKGDCALGMNAAMDAEMASWKSTGTYVDAVPPSGANIVHGMWIFRVKRPPGTPLVFKARYVARGFSQRQGVDFFHTFSPTRKMTTTLVLLHVAAQRDYELHSLDFNTAFLQGSLHEEIWLRHPPGFTGSFPADTQWSLRRPVYTHSEHKKMATRPVHM
ncbi:unnamed protein product [Closterium sp. NIES-54]